MADRRCVHRKIVESDAFYSLPAPAQALYMHLVVAADDDGFINSAASIASRVQSGKQALSALVQKRFVLKYDDIYIIKHWRVSNSLKNDRTKPPTYPAIAQRIWVKNTRAYTDHPVDGCQTLYEVKGGVLPESGMESNAESHNGIQFGTLKEQNRTEQKGTEQNRTEPPCAAVGGADAFERFWNAYPADKDNGFDKAEAWKAWQTVAAPETVDKIMQSLATWKASEDWAKNGGQYIPRPANWLRGRWKEAPKRPGQTGTERTLDEDEILAIRRMMQEAKP